MCACVVSADISTVICDKVEKAQVLLGNVERKETPGLRRIILMDACNDALEEQGKGCGVHVQTLQEVEVLHVGNINPSKMALQYFNIYCILGNTCILYVK